MTQLWSLFLGHSLCCTSCKGLDTRGVGRAYSWTFHGTEVGIGKHLLESVNWRFLTFWEVSLWRKWCHHQIQCLMDWQQTIVKESYKFQWLESEDLGRICPQLCIGWYSNTLLFSFHYFLLSFCEWSLLRYCCEDLEFSLAFCIHLIPFTLKECVRLEHQEIV